MKKKEIQKTVVSKSIPDRNLAEVGKCRGTMLLLTYCLLNFMLFHLFVFVICLIYKNHVSINNNITLL